MKKCGLLPTFPPTFIMSVQKKFLISTGIARNVQQAADYILFMQIMISAHINVCHKISD